MSTRYAVRVVSCWCLLTLAQVTGAPATLSIALAPANPARSFVAVEQNSTDYDDLVALFYEFRESGDATNSAGVPDYSAPAVAERYQVLQQFRERLAAYDIDAWPIWQQVDYHLVRAEMNAVEFHHRVHKPWARDPGFYSVRGGDAGASIDAETFTRPLFALEPPFSADEKARYQATLRAIPGIYEQARRNLTEAAGDLAVLAIRNAANEARIYDRIAQRLQDPHPDLVADARAAGQAVRDYAAWLEANLDDMTAPAGIGKDNYSWWMRNVQLSPWGWEESNAIIEREYDRIITFLKLEEQRNRDLPPLEVDLTMRDYEASVFLALHAVVEFLRDEEIMTIDDWVNPADYTGFASLAELDEQIAREGSRGDERLLPENSSVDTKYRQREMLPGETHEFIGHMLDYQRQERQTFSPIRSAGRRYNMGSMRTEGWAVALEELLMQAGVLDDRPRKGREMEYLMNASHMSLSIPDMKMHANEINLEEARHLLAEIMPRGWSSPDENMVWFEMQSNIRNPGGFHSNVVTGKAYFMKLFRERAQELGDAFVLRDFIDEFLASGIIPIPLIRWEMTGNNDDIALVTEPFPESAGSDAARPGASRASGAQTSSAPPGMAAIPAGAFMMGDADGQDMEEPVHEVELDAFYMDTHEVTLQEFGAFVGATGHVTDAEKNGGSIIWNGEDYAKTEGIDWRFDAAGDRHPPEHGSQPATHLSWNDANAYCEWAGKRLPSEAEWEYAARGGERGYKFAWGNEPLGNEVVANVSDENFVKVVTTWPHTEGYDDGYTFGAPVGSFPPNSLGLYDMSGNAWEWVADYFDPEFYRRSTTKNPRNDVPNERRSMRGNSWDGRPGLMRASRRTSDLQSNSYADTGFRCAKDHQ